jgi:hypothetical protein
MKIQGFHHGTGWRGVRGEANSSTSETGTINIPPPFPTIYRRPFYFSEGYDTAICHEFVTIAKKLLENT